MRWLFLFLLTLNLAYFAWYTFMPAGDVKPELPAQKNARLIVLSSELDNNAQPVSSHEDKAEKEVVAEVSTGPDTAGSDSLLVNKENESQPVLDVTATSTATASATPKATGDENAAIISAGKSYPEESCYSLGPFPDTGQLHGLKQELQPYAMSIDFRNEEEHVSTLYWVYLPPVKSRSAARKVGEKLKAGRIKDFYIIREGENNNGISLGYFRSEKRATRLEKKVKALGFDVQLETIVKNRPIYWLDYRLHADKKVPDEIIQKYIQTDEEGKISLSGHECDSR
jgi:hypothetical protein